MPINPGDIAFAGYNSTDPDQFALVTLTSLTAGDTFIITDGGFISLTAAANTTFRPSEGFLQYTVPVGGIAAGSVLVFSIASLTVVRNGGGDAGTVVGLANSGGSVTLPNLAAAGDQLTIYTVTGGTHLTGTPTLIAFVDFGSGAYVGAGSTNASNIPTIAGGQVLDLVLDNATFNATAPVAGQTIAALSNGTNFTSQNTTAYDLTTLASGIVGTASGETLSGGAAAENIQGLDGDDILNGAGGNDVLIGGNGLDQLNGDAGADTMIGGAGNDVYAVDNIADTITELDGEGVDYVKTTLSSFTLPDFVEIVSCRGAGDFNGTGNALDNGIYGGNANDTVSGLDGNDTLSTDAGTDILNGGNGNDRLFGGTGADIMNGGAGSDELYVDDAGDVANGGADIDTLFVTAALTYSIAADVENVTVLTGGAVNITLNALDNIFDGGAGANSASGGDGSDLLAGRGDDDIFFGDGGVDTLRGNGGSDELTGGLGNDILDGGDGNDFLFGGDDDDFLNGNAGADQMDGGAGNDTFIVENVGDTVVGGDGTDTILLQGVTAFTVAADVEIVDAVSNVGATVNLGDNDNIFGASLNGGLANLGGGNDSFFGRGATDNVNAGAGNDRVNGYAGVDTLLGDAGNDVLEGGDDDDTLNGGADDDTLYGEAGNDAITGGAGRDYLSGGSGADFFDFLSVSDTGATAATADRIVDFDGSQGDRISLQTIDADTNIADNQAFTFIGNADFSNVAGQLRYEQIGSNTFVQGDVDGDGIADFVIQLDGLIAPVATDFLL